MADKKISELVSITGSATAADDYFVVVDTSGAVTHKISREELNNAIEQDVLSSIEITDITNDVNVQGTVTADGLTVEADGTHIYLKQTNGDFGHQFRQANDGGALQIGRNVNGTFTEAMRVSGGNVGIGASAVAANTKLHVKAGTNLNFEVENASSTLRLSALNDARSANIPMQFASSSFQFISGNVGIGNTIPSSFYSLADNLVVGTGSGGNGITIYSGSADSGYIGFNDTASASMQGFIQYNHNGDYMAFAPNGTEKMRITAGGNVGIGTSSPASPTGFGTGGILHLKGSTGNDASIVLEGLSGSGGRQEIGVSSGALQFYRGAATGSMTESIRITSAGDLLAGKTSTSINTAGSRLIGGGAGAQFTADGTEALALNRLTSDGDLIWLGKAGSKVGSIGVASTDNFYFAAADGAGLKVDSDLSSGVTPCNSSGADLDASINIGHASARWNNLYLSGGVYLGGTGSANYLDDYEEGTWNVTIVNGGLTPSVTSASYTKIGNRVFLSCHLVVPTNSESLYMALGGLPFSTSGDSGGSLGYTTATTSGSIGLLVQSSTIYFYKDGTPYATSEFSNKQLRLSAQYRTV